MASVQDRISVILPTLNDTVQDRHTNSKLLGYYRDALKEACVLRPDLFAQDVSFSAIAGVEQAVPSTVGVHLLDVYRTNNSGELTKGDYNTMRSFMPGWRSASAGPATMWMTKPGSDKARAMNRAFFLWPPQRGTETIFVCAAVVQDLAGGVTTTIVLDDHYLPIIDHYVVARCEMEDDEYAVSGRASAQMQLFLQGLGVGKAVKDEKVKA